jgi:hypothetical protein
MSNVMRQSSPQRLPSFILGASLAVLAVSQITSPIALRFSHDVLNYLSVGLAALGVPSALAWLAFRMQGPYKPLVLTLAAVLAIPLGVYGLLALSEGTHVTNGIHASLKPLDETKVGSAIYRLYQTDCGATCAYGLALRKEYDAPILLKAVSTVWSADGEDGAELRVGEDGKAQVVRGNYVLYAHDD